MNVAAGAVVAAMVPIQVDSADPAAPLLAKPPRWHLFFGFDGAEESLFGHDGLVWAPAGHLHETGWRLRAGSSAGVHTYRSAGRRFTGELYTLELLGGFQWLTPVSGFAVYAGPVVQDASSDPRDPDRPRQGTRFGAKLKLEGWYRPADGVYFNLSGQYASAAQTYAIRFAPTLEIAARWALEPEVAAFGEPGHDARRAGLIVEFRLSERWRLRAGGGWRTDSDEDGSYATVEMKIWR
ncbi:cellulose biosynthesis protein BcsS [Tepidamorphus gemmatus]|uniref:Cellulose biosynthesis protein BcsS n=1 Tax=Tepidamorphus gemmatus TaxID=747076 RepID=A0A4R3MA44_9HYPH|nr:cellulose biosynthesis protein BcsS [Tepidamorphus gemmatus]TCT10012.1 cellulose biosynthesis protein BcsS [Tepidamorphus gemmatus]